MTLIINIPDDEYNILITSGAWFGTYLAEYVKNGTPLDGTTNGEVILWVNLSTRLILKQLINGGTHLIRKVVSE